MKDARTLHPLWLLGLALVAAYIVIGTGPRFVPVTGSTVRLEAVLYKAGGAGLFLLASFHLLRRHPLGPEILGLTLHARNLGWFAVASLAGVMLVGLGFLILRVFVPFHFEPGAMSTTELCFSILIYLFGALLEELAFRGYPLLRLRERYGSVIAIPAVSFAFGLLHLSGMFGMSAVKMIVTTGLCSVLFSLAYLRSGTLWSAVGLHMGMNVMLHSVLGGGQGPSRLRMVYDSPLPPPFDAGFWSFVLVLLVMIGGLALPWPRRTGIARDPGLDAV